MWGSRVEKLWDGIQDLENLKRIDLSRSEYLLKLPDFSKASNLQEVKLRECRKLRNVHPSILSLNKLERLDLCFCDALTSLRSETHLRSLRHLNLLGCIRLEEFSVTSKNMEELDLTMTAINELPSSIGSLKRLEKLSLAVCENLKYIPNEVAKLKSLRQLHVHGSALLDPPNLHILFNGLGSLETLQLACWSKLIEVLDNISLLSSLRNLSIIRTNIERFPPTIKHLSKLEKLFMRGCERLLYLPELPPTLKELAVDGCSSLETVMFTSNVAELQLQATERRYTQFKNCVKLDERSLSAIGVSACLNMKKFTYDNLLEIGSMVEVIYPGSEVPEWFKYRTTQASVTVDLCSSPPFEFMGFICCVTFCQSPSITNAIRCNCYLETDNGEKRFTHGPVDKEYEIRGPNGLLSDHVFMWYDQNWKTMNSKMKVWLVIIQRFHLNSLLVNGENWENGKTFLRYKDVECVQYTTHNIPSPN